MSETNIEWGTPGWYLSNMKLGLDLIDADRKIVESGNMKGYDKSFVTTLWGHLKFYLYSREELKKA